MGHWKQNYCIWQLEYLQKHSEIHFRMALAILNSGQVLSTMRNKWWRKWKKVWQWFFEFFLFWWYYTGKGKKKKKNWCWLEVNLYQDNWNNHFLLTLELYLQEFTESNKLKHRKILNIHLYDIHISFFTFIYFIIIYF